MRDALISRGHFNVNEEGVICNHANHRPRWARRHSTKGAEGAMFSCRRLLHRPPSCAAIT